MGEQLLPLKEHEKIEQKFEQNYNDFYDYSVVGKNNLLSREFNI